MPGSRCSVRPVTGRTKQLQEKLSVQVPPGRGSEPHLRNAVRVVTDSAILVVQYNKIQYNELQLARQNLNKKARRPDKFLCQKIVNDKITNRI